MTTLADINAELIRADLAGRRAVSKRDRARVWSDRLLDGLERLCMQVGPRRVLPGRFREHLRRLATAVDCELRPQAFAVQDGIDACFALQQLILHGCWFTGPGVEREPGRHLLVDDYPSMPEPQGRAFPVIRGRLRGRRAAEILIVARSPINARTVSPLRSVRRSLGSPSATFQLDDAVTALLRNHFGPTRERFEQFVQDGKADKSIGLSDAEERAA